MISGGSIHYVEEFHLLFLAQLNQKLNRKHYALKGGCNMRFFFRSPRYSEDIDFDAIGIETHQLQDRIGEIFKSKGFMQILEARKLSIENLREHKQTETTQRWKMSIHTPFSEIPLPTKIEFSKRGTGEELIFESIDPEIGAKHQMPPLLINHYPPETAMLQKTSAIISRSTVQARDIFDLHLLIQRGVKPANIRIKFTEEQLEIAEKNIMLVDFKLFQSQVLGYLTPEYQGQYDDESAWDDIRLKSVEFLKGS
ncbi:MAG TPA: hypothetical protein DCZ94_19155 [Lentisphaeria bacterium]|nr:MAG: hypothetical protein A2X48_08955 [Lentisphaerae bacterium GWF2_49_21]HBC89063.1 hypothetical protein [Lentisphaeria bacterium]